MVIIITPKGRAFHSPFGKKITRITSLFHEVSKSKQIATVLEKWGWNVTASPPTPPPGKLVIERGFIHPSRVCSVYYVPGIVLDTGALLLVQQTKCTHSTAHLMSILPRKISRVRQSRGWDTW